MTKPKSLGTFAEEFMKFHRIPQGFKIVIRERRGKKRLKRGDQFVRASRLRREFDDLKDAQTVEHFFDRMQRHASPLDEWVDDYKFTLEAPEKGPVHPGVTLGEVRAMEPALTVIQLAEADKLQRELAALMKAAERKKVPPRLVLRATIQALKSRDHRTRHIVKAA